MCTIFLKTVIFRLIIWFIGTINRFLVKLLSANLRKDLMDLISADGEKYESNKKLIRRVKVSISRGKCAKCCLYKPLLLIPVWLENFSKVNWNTDYTYRCLWMIVILLPLLVRFPGKHLCCVSKSMLLCTSKAFYASLKAVSRNSYEHTRRKQNHLRIISAKLPASGRVDILPCKGVYDVV